MLALLLAIATVLALLPPAAQTQAAHEADFTAIVTAAYDSFAASNHQANAADNAIDAFLEPALYGNGSTLHFGKNHAVTAALYETALFREAFIKAVSTAFTSMQDSHVTRLMVSSGCSWYDFLNSYSIRHYQDKDYGKAFSGVENNTSLVYYNVIASEAPLQAAANRCDTAFGLCVGGASVRLLIEQIELTDETVTYHVDIQVSDKFNFDGSYSGFDKKGYNTRFAKLLTLLGPLLGLKTYQWYSETEMTITVPNTCDHAGEGK